MVPEEVQIVWALYGLFVLVGLPFLYLIVAHLDDRNRRKTMKEYRRQAAIINKWRQARCKDSY